MVLVMTVEPGFGGQAFMVSQLEMIREVRALLDLYNPTCNLEVDGGITAWTAALVKNAGANVLVADSAIFGEKNRTDAIQVLRDA